MLRLSLAERDLPRSDPPERTEPEGALLCREGLQERGLGTRESWPQKLVVLPNSKKQSLPDTAGDNLASDGDPAPLPPASAGARLLEAFPGEGWSFFASKAALPRVSPHPRQEFPL